MGAEIEELEEGRLVVNGLEVTRSSPNLRSVDFFFPRSRGRETLLLGKERAILLDRRGVKVMSVERAVKHLASRMLETEVSKREAVRSEAESP
ncbi:hypothetical protein HS1genome_1420 [Sulfodiicoccus acidiphilus]|nr:hypothetical protein [Sulfodiicoccus acidiphilus]BBD73031.1 hypothetical protein HS1genome_1420 [Sulfodiicoccus acidiphilus]